MKSWLFRNYDEKAFGIFRIILYLSFFLFYHYIVGLDYQDWLSDDFRVFYEPISFFKMFSFDDLAVLKNIDGLFYWKISLVLSALGLLYPLSSFTSFLGILIFAGLPLNFGKIHHLNHLPVMILGIMAFSLFPGGYSLDRYLFKRAAKFRQVVSIWPIRTAQIYMCLIYFASGWQKILNTGTEWIFSDNMQVIILSRLSVTELGLWIAEFPLLCQFLALTTVVAQSCAPLALIIPRLRFPIVLTLFSLHIGTFLVLGNDGFFFPYNLCFLVWLPWERITGLFCQMIPKLKSKIL